jgi:outer membrane protein OmpA-like peptidoglycan-associated protein
MACLSEDDVIAFVSGELAPEALARAEKHLDVCPECRGIVSAFAATNDHLVSVRQMSTLAPGDCLVGRYEILRLVARGGMGEVYEARDRLLDEVVALKTIVLTALDNQRMLGRLKAEVQLARKVSHRNVCRILEFGVHRKTSAEGAWALPFFTMEFLQGETLGKRLARAGRMTTSEALPIVLQVLEGLAAIHAAGIVHRDLKPENVCLLEETSGVRAVVMDFGVARSLNVPRSLLSLSGEPLMGTLEYMAPEQLRGETPTPAFDVYAFGVVIFEMLTGKRPFARSHAGSLANALRRLEADAPLLSSQLPGANPHWERVIAHCLARPPTDRFRDVGQLRAALLDESRWPLPRSGRRLSRTTGLALAGVLALAAIFARGGWTPATPPMAGRTWAPAEARTGSRPTTQPGRAARTITVALCQWPGHMPLVVGNGGLTTQPGSAAAAEDLDLRLVFKEDAPSKNRALETGEVDVTWQTVDELPISLANLKRAGVEARAFMQLDWSRGGDACVAAASVRSVEDLLGRKSAMLRFSPEHTLFEFMLSNSRLTPEQAAQVRLDASFFADDFLLPGRLFRAGKVDLACLWEPDVTLALAERPGAHTLFSTADATHFLTDVLIARRELLDDRSDAVDRLARVWFAGVARAESDRAAAARLIAGVVPRFRDEAGYERTLRSFDWVSWTDLGDNVSFFGLHGQTALFDRNYNNADALWVNYPAAAIKDRFAPVAIRDDRTIRRLWERAGRPPPPQREIDLSGQAPADHPLFTKPLSVHFPFRAADLDVRAMEVLNTQLLPQVQIARGMFVRVEGNTDGVEGDRGLSRKRALAIVDYLGSRGVNRNRLLARGNGPRKPIASNTTEKGRALNRRTDVLFIPLARTPARTRR